MKKFRMNRSGFTLIELLVVIIIVAVLAAVGLPLLQGNIARARLSEVDASLGTIRTNLRAYLAEHGDYPIVGSGSVTAIAAGTPVIGGPNPVPGVQAGDLTGRWFDDDDFTYQSDPTSVLTTVGTYCIKALGDNDTYVAGSQTIAPKASQVNGVQRTMDETGDIFTSADCSGTAIN